MQIRLPKLGEGADSGTVVAVLVKEGDQVAKDQPIIELENEKAVASIPASAAGTVQTIHVKPGDKLTVGQPILTLAGAKASPAAAPKATPEADPGRGTQPTGKTLEISAEDVAALEDDAGEPTGPVPPAAPSVRKLARELGIDLRRVRGSEPGGRVVAADLRAYVRRLQAKASQPEAAAQPAAAPSAEAERWGPVKREPFSALRQTLAARLVGSWTSIPHVTQFDDADVTALLALKQQVDAAYAKQGTKLTVTAILLKLIAKTLVAHPKFNASLDEAKRELVLKQAVHLGIAVDTEAGLMVPVLRDVHKKTLREVSRELNDLAERTRGRTLSAEDMQGSSFTVSNQGGIGGGAFTPIIKPPDVAILGLGQARSQAVVRDGAVVARTMLPLGLSYDHRVIDGGDAARFVAALVGAIEGVTEREVQP